MTRWDGTRRDGIFSPEFRKAGVARQVRPVRARSHLAAQLDPIKPYIYGGSKPDSQPEVSGGEERNQVSDQRARLVHEHVMLRFPQQSGRPLTKAELLPGLWVERATGKYGQWSRDGLLALDLREPRRVVMWSLHTVSQGRAHLVLGPAEPRDASMPVHEIRPLDPGRFSAEQRELLTAYADRSVYNHEIGEFEIPA
ncbi:hypothetical protein [Streptomyces sp. NPDC007083]|uniref:hypothetical protein n=1 Tax=Streptomyces sp. NPDC007083 TaxID=3156913 RepID=UPI0033C4F11A